MLAIQHVYAGDGQHDEGARRQPMAEPLDGVESYNLPSGRGMRQTDRPAHDVKTDDDEEHQPEGNRADDGDRSVAPAPPLFAVRLDQHRRLLVRDRHRSGHALANGPPHFRIAGVVEGAPAESTAPGSAFLRRSRRLMRGSKDEEGRGYRSEDGHGEREPEERSPKCVPTHGRSSPVSSVTGTGAQPRPTRRSLVPSPEAFRATGHCRRRRECLTSSIHGPRSWAQPDRRRVHAAPAASRPARGGSGDPEPTPLAWAEVVRSRVLVYTSNPPIRPARQINRKSFFIRCSRPKLFREHSLAEVSASQTFAGRAGL